MEQKTTELDRIAAGRDHLLTAEFGRAIGRSGQTVRKNLCNDGHAYGIRPRKLGGRLLWPVAEIAKLLAASER
jgi:hypothetical protein